MNNCQMDRTNITSRHSPESKLEAHCYQLHDVFEMFYGTTTVPQDNEVVKQVQKESFAAMKFWLGEIEKLVEANK